MTQAGAEVDEPTAVGTVSTVIAVTGAQVAAAVGSTTAPAAASSPIGTTAIASPAGSPGPAGLTGGRFTTTATQDTPALTVCALQDGVAHHASSLDPDDGTRVLGVALTGSLASESLTLLADGDMPANLDDGVYFLGPDGALTTDRDTGVLRVRIGYVTGSTLYVRISTTTLHA